MQIANTPSFGRLVKAHELASVKELVQKVPSLGEPVASQLTKDTVAITHAPHPGTWWFAPSKLWKPLRLLTLIPFIIADKFRIDSAMTRQLESASEGSKAYGIQWVRHPNSQSDTLETFNPCQGDSCPVLSDGSPATGGATLGHDEIRWWAIEKNTSNCETT